MAYDIGPRIGIQGEAEFNRQIKNINNALRECGSEMKALSSEFEDNANSQDALIAKNKNLQKELDLQRQKMNLLQGQYDKQVQKLNELAQAYQKAKTENGEMSSEASKAETAFNKQAETVSKLSVAMNETQNYMNKLGNSMSKNDKMLDEIASGARDAATGYSEVDNASRQAADGLEETNKKLDAGNMMDAAEALSGVGDKIIEAGQKSYDAFADLEGAISRVNGYFGLTGDAAEQMGTVVENVFKTGVTDSLQEVGDAVIYVNNNLKDLDPSQLETITTQAITMKQVFGSDMSETMRGVNALMVNFGLDAQTAMDYIVTGSQNGLDKTQELGDNLSEYSGKFSQAGYSAQEYFQLLQNGLEGGAYNLDKVNDSINEVTTRLSDGTIADAIGQFSTETQNTFKAWQEGGATQKDVINSIVSDIANCTNQQEQLTMASTAFGTMGEDANMGVVTSLTTLGDAYNNVSGAAQQMGEDTTTPMQKLQGAINELLVALAPLGEKLANLATEILPPFIDFITKLIDGFLNLPGPVQTFIGVLAGLVALLTTLAPIITAIVTVVGTFGTAVLGPLIGVIAGVAAAITTIIVVIQNWGSITEWIGEVWEKIKTKLSEIWNTIKDTASNVFNSIKDFFSNIWNAITTTISNAVEKAKMTVTAVWNAIKFTISSILSNIKQTFANIWNAITTTISNAVEKAKMTVTAVWNAIKFTVSSILSNIKQTFSDIWNSIKDTVSNIVTSIKEKAVNIFNNMVSGIKNSVSKVYTAVKSGFDKAINFIKSLPSKAIQWGKDFINGLKNGIMAGVNKIVDAVRKVANKIRSFLHFSRPDEGPLRDYETWMPDFMSGLADGIYRNIDKIEKAASDVSGTINSTITGRVADIANNTPTLGGGMIVVDGDTIVLDGKAIGKSATKYISTNQQNNLASKGVRLRYV